MAYTLPKNFKSILNWLDLAKEYQNIINVDLIKTNSNCYYQHNKINITNKNPFVYIDELELLNNDPIVDKPKPIITKPKTDIILKGKKPEPPEYPESWECCGMGCKNCVYTLYDEAFEVYEQELKQWKVWRDEQIKAGITVEDDDNNNNNNDVNDHHHHA